MILSRLRLLPKGLTSTTSGPPPPFLNMCTLSHKHFHFPYYCHRCRMSTPSPPYLNMFTLSLSQSSLLQHTGSMHIFTFITSPNFQLLHFYLLSSSQCVPCVHIHFPHNPSFSQRAHTFSSKHFHFPQHCQLHLNMCTLSSFSQN